ncbi:DDB1- and CUL4-associated factor 11 isoform X1 [Lampetra fluviatilis]
MGSRASRTMSAEADGAEQPERAVAGGGAGGGGGGGGVVREVDSSEEGDEDVDLAQILAFLLHRGQVRLIRNAGTGLHLVSNFSESDEDSDSGWDGRLGDRYNPPVDQNPDTKELDCSEIQQQILLATGGLGGRPIRGLTHLLHKRERGMCRSSAFSQGECSHITTSFLPNQMTQAAHFTQKAFCGVFSQDGSIFMSACQDQNVRLFDARKGGFKKFKTVKARDVGWSVLDTAFTPDGTHFLYSSWSDYIHVCNIYGEHETHTALDLNPDERRFCVFSLTVSLDSREVLGGANDGCLYVFDRERNQRTLKIDAHEDDVNTVAFADASSQILFSGGDDALCKVWDRRTLREDSPQPVGVLAGHRDGVTFIDTKGDARYLISNSKDQSIKLWDVRRFSPKEGLEASRQAVTQQNWDYRWQQVPKRALKKHKLPGDTSVMTYRGHGVLHTLIRCRFSPEFSTGQRYVYTGCSTGKVVVYEVLSGKVVARLNGHRACVRDVHWHPYDGKIVSTSWDGVLGLWQYKQGEFHEGGDPSSNLQGSSDGKPAAKP